MKTLIDLRDVLSEDLQQVLDIFDAELASDLDCVNRLVEFTRDYRGKMLRPQLLLLVGKSFGPLNRHHLVLAAVVEMVHMATLVHDDVLDEAEIRRRGPTINHRIGNEGAVLLGDYLISHSYHLCSSLDSTQFAQRIAAITNTVCEGELLQIANRGNWDLTESTYLEIIRRKTGALTSVAAELGAAAAGASNAVIQRMADFGMELGMAFQIVDDLLDLLGSPESTGKSVGRDADLGKLTLPGIHFLKDAGPRQRESFIAAISAPESSNGDLAGLLAGSDALNYARTVAASHISRAIQHLGVLPAGDAREALQSIAHLVLERTH
ncbi:MAG TPA: polyprenyl synthetase family protein [Phycisphaerae bacterium]|nr:polyprenyl synthetase family protein [Phycisphaerae bacterium]